MTKPLLYKCVILAVLGILSLWSFVSLPSGEKSIKTIAGDIDSSLTANQGEAVISEESPVSSSNHEATLYLVTKVIDGDTIEIEGGKQVRYIGIDTPEAKSKDCLSLEATEKNKQFVLGKKIRLEKDISEADSFGRLLRYAYVGNNFVNLELVNGGFARSYRYPPDIKYQADFDNAQKSAKNKELGMWGSVCNKIVSSSAMPTVSVTPSPVISNTPVPIISTTVAPTAIPTLAPTHTPVPTVSQATPTPIPTIEASPLPITGHIYYLSTYHTSKYYYCDTDNGWKILSKKYLKSYNSEDQLLADYPTRTLHTPCK